VVSLPFRTQVAGKGLRLDSPAGFFVEVAIALFYGVLCGSSRGQTLGMMAVGVRAVDARAGGPIGISRGIGRAVIEYVLAAVLFVPWVIDMLFPLWDPNNQTLHDKATATVVIKL